jgi:putative ABC transport system permease protein
MTFVLRMVARELRASWRRLLFFFVCVAIGVGAIVALRSVIQSVRIGLMREARAIVSADVLVSTNRPWRPEVRERLDRRLATAPVLQRLEAIETATMVRGEHGAAAKMVELKGVQEGFPLYGEILLADGRTFSHDLLKGRGALVRPELLVQLGIRAGDALIIGGQPFAVRGVIEKEPGRRVGAFSFGSRVLVDYDDLRATGLLTFGSRASYQVQLRVRDDAVGSLVRDLRRELRNDFVNARSYQSTEDNIGEDLQRAENYLSLVGFVMVILGGIGVWSVTRVFVRQKIRSVAILKCVGATTGQILSAYVAQVTLLGLAGSSMGVVIAWIVIASIPESLAASFGGVAYGLTLSAVLQGLFVGLVVSVLFALAPLLEVRRVKPLLLLRGVEAQAPRARVDWIQVGVIAIVSAALVSIAAWQAASWMVGLIVSGGFAAVTLLLHGAGMLLVRAVRPLAAASWFPLRHAVGSLRRPGNQTRVILLAVGLGSFFVIAVRALQANLIEEFSITLDQAGADMFLIDIQQDQLEGVRQIVKSRAGVEPRLIPVLRARVTGISGKENNLETVSDVRNRGGISREFVITYRNQLEPNEKLVEGTFWSGQPPLPDDATELQVTVERGIHERSRIAVGDLMRFDILGRIVNARVVGIREVEWADARNGGFMFVFRPGPLERAPHTYIGTLRAPEAVSERATLQRDLVAAYPNVSAIDVREVLATIQGIVDNVTLAISIVGGVAVGSGMLILIGAVAMTKFQRVYEAAILRTLGASTRLLTTMLALEYSALGLLAGSIGAAGALALTWGICRYVFEIPWRPAPGVLATGALITTALVGIIGVVASFDVLRKKPLATLRAE